jgi:hypothetical protein
VREAIARKPRKHDFMIAPDMAQKQLTRHMNVTGG